MIKMKSLLIENVTETPEFKRWFGNSKVVDNNGDPLVVYKGIPIKDTEGNPITSIQRQSEFPAFHHGEPGVKLAGFFSADKKVADKFAMNLTKPGFSHVIETYLKIENPFIIDMKGGFSGNAQFGLEGLPFRNAIRSGKYDGVFILNTKDEGNVYVPLKANQIKSINNTSFNIDNPEYTKEYKI